MRLRDHSRLNPVLATNPANAFARADFNLGILPDGSSRRACNAHADAARTIELI
jgi:hypothetical protein